MQKTLRFFIIVLLLAAATACGGSPAPAVSSPVPEITETSEPTATQPPPPTPTTPAPLLIVLAPDGGDSALQSMVEAQAAALAAERGLRWQIRQQMSAEEINAEASFVVALPPQQDLNALVAGAPQANFLVVNLPGVVPAPNLILVQTPTDSSDIEAFMGGYIGALMTEDWRLGIITVQDGAEQLRFAAFENGMRFFCGLCRPQYAPFYEYPFKLSLPASASSVEWRSLADFMRDRLVGTVYVSPGAGTEEMLATLAELNVNIIGSTRPPAGLEDHWVASLRSEPDAAYETYFPRLLDGESDLVITLPIELLDINESKLGLGKQRLANQTLADLLDGFILTGDVP